MKEHTDRPEIDSPVPVKVVADTVILEGDLGVPDEAHECILVIPDSEKAVIGGKLY